jgi:hypothetical protein
MELATIIKVSAANGFGFTTDEAKEFVGGYVRRQWMETNEVAHYLHLHCQFGEDKVPGKDWLAKFMKTHHLSLQKPGTLEKTRKLAEANPFLIYEFYDFLEQVAKELQLSDRPECVWNLDESPFWLDPKSGKVMAEIGVKTQRITAGPGRSCLTVMGCVAANGVAHPPLFIFEGKNLYANWKGTSEDVPPGTTYACSGKKCINHEF